MAVRLFLLLLASTLALAQAPSQKQEPATAPGERPQPAPPRQGEQEKDEAAKKAREAETALQAAIEKSGNDRAALVRNLEEYLKRFPDAPHRAAIYRALAESCAQLHDSPCALDYAERFIAVSPDDPAVMLFAADLLERRGDDQSLAKAVGYISRVLDRIEKSPLGPKPARVSEAEWELEQKKTRMTVYLIRGRLEMEQRNYDPAEKDLETSYNGMANPAAAERLGEIAEVHKNAPGAIDRYLEAFVLPDTSGPAVDRRDVRRKLGNLWRQVHGSEAGLGEAVLAAYDRLLAAPTTGTPAAAHNKDAKEPFAFTLRKLDGSPLPLAQFKGKVLVLDFWATWCLPCRELEPLLGQVGKKYEGQADVAFLAVNGEDDESRVAPYVAREKLAVPVAFADGFDDFLGVKSLPTIIVLDRTGKIAYSAAGYNPETFAQSLSAAIERALRGAR